MLARTWKIWTSHTLLVEIYNSSATVENSQFTQNITHRIIISSHSSTPRHITKRNENKQLIKTVTCDRGGANRRQGKGISKTPLCFLYSLTFDPCKAVNNNRTSTLLNFRFKNNFCYSMKSGSLESKFSRYHKIFTISLSFT